MQISYLDIWCDISDNHHTWWYDNGIWWVVSPILAQDNLNIKWSSWSFMTWMPEYIWWYSWLSEHIIVIHHISKKMHRTMTIFHPWRYLKKLKSDGWTKHIQKWDSTTALSPSFFRSTHCLVGCRFRRHSTNRGIWCHAGHLTMPWSTFDPTYHQRQRERDIYIYTNIYKYIHILYICIHIYIYIYTICISISESKCI